MNLELVEVRGVEPLSETESTKHLRVYYAIDLDRSTPTHGLIPSHPLDSAPLNERVEPLQAWPDKLCFPAHRASAVQHRGRSFRRRERNRCSQLQFLPVFLRGQRVSTTRNL